MVNRANGTRANGHRANGNRADVVAPCKGHDVLHFLRVECQIKNVTLKCIINFS